MKRCALLIALLAVSCQMVHRVTDTAAELFGDGVVARVGDHRLMRSELAEYIPAGVSSEDSLGLAQQYIKASCSWTWRNPAFPRKNRTCPRNWRNIAARC